MPSVGPQLPPHLAEKRKRDEEGEDSRSSSSPDSASKRPRVIGPAPPPAPLDERPLSSPTKNEDPKDEESDNSSDDDGFGPALPTAADAKKPSAMPQSQATQTQSIAPPKRDEWMTIAPAHGDWSTRVDPTKLKNRKFGTGKGPSKSESGGDSWHETPEQKQARLKREIMGIKDDPKVKPLRPEASKGDLEDEATRKRMKEYSAARGPSLYESRQGKEQEKDDDPSARAFDREKDIGGGLQINSTQRKDMMKKASDFGSRFSSAKYL